MKRDTLLPVKIYYIYNQMFYPLTNEFVDGKINLLLNDFNQIHIMTLDTDLNLSVRANLINENNSFDLVKLNGIITIDILKVGIKMLHEYIKWFK